MASITKLPSLPTGSRSDERAATRARRSSAATTPTLKPVKRRPRSNRGWRRTSHPFPASRPLATSSTFIFRYVRGTETAASRAKTAMLTTLKRDLGKEKIIGQKIAAPGETRWGSHVAMALPARSGVSVWWGSNRIEQFWNFQISSGYAAYTLAMTGRGGSFFPFSAMSPAAFMACQIELCDSGALSVMSHV